MKNLSPEGWKNIAAMNAGEWDATEALSGQTFGRHVYALSSDSYDVIRLALMEQIDSYTHWLEVGKSPDYWASELWAINRALRELGIED